jgi:hypothetical protein
MNCAAMIYILIMRIAWLFSILLAVPVLASDCGTECTTAGCSDSITVEVPTAAISANQVQMFQACIDTRCAKGTLKPAGGGSMCATDLWGFCFLNMQKTTSLIVVPVSETSLLSDGRGHTVSFELMTGDGKTLQTSRMVSFSIVAPNGPGCGPTCHQGLLSGI